MKRYDCYNCAEESPDGEYVRYEDMPRWQPLSEARTETTVVFMNLRANGYKTQWVSEIDDIGWADDKQGYHHKLENIMATHFMLLPEDLDI